MVTTDEGLTAYDWGKNQIAMSSDGVVRFFLGALVEIHHKEDGDLEDKPVFMFNTRVATGDLIGGQVSLSMLNEALAEIGYEMKKIKK